MKRLKRYECLLCHKCYAHVGWAVRHRDRQHLGDANFSVISGQLRGGYL